MDIDDKHYKKYIKYKTKYLELKEQLGGGRHMHVRGRHRPRHHTPVRKYTPKIQYVSSETRPISNKQSVSSEKSEFIDLDNFMTSYIGKEKNKYDEIFNSQIPNKIFLIEDFLLNNLLKEILIYDTKTEDLVVKIYKQICNTILNYREYFYLNVDKNSKTEELLGGWSFFDFFKSKKAQPESNKAQPESNKAQPESKKTKPESNKAQPESNKAQLEIITIDKLQKRCIHNINAAQIIINNLLKDKKYKSTKLNNIITIYFSSVNESIQKNMYSVFENKIKFKINDIYNKINNEISDDNITNKINALPNPKNNYNEFIKNLYNIQKLLKLKVLYNSNINITVSSDDYIMLINCFLFVFKLKLVFFKQITVMHNDLYFDLVGGDNDNDIIVDIIVDKNIVINILNTLIKIILFFTQNINTKENHIKNKDNYTLEYNGKEYTLSKDVANQLIDVIIKDIQSYLPNNIFITELKKYIDLKLELQV
jgi:hypothetical protein